MSILVAGGAGYIGSHVCKYLKNQGHDVLVLDNLSKGYRSFVKWGKLLQGDIRNRAFLNRVFSENRIDAVMHFCAFIEAGESVKDPAIFYENNTSGTLNLLQAMMKAGVDKFIFSSTAAVYGNPKILPISEESELSPINPYGRSKLMVEQMLQDFDDAYDLKSIRFRYFNAAGADPDGEIGEAHVPESHLIPLILDAAMGKREDIKLFGSDYETTDGTCVRDYIHVNDLASAHATGLNHLLSGGESDVFNLGSGEGYSVLQMIETAKRVTGKDFKVTRAPRREGDPDFLIADSTKALVKLGWKTKFGLEEIIRDAWNWHPKRAAIEKSREA